MVGKTYHAKYADHGGYIGRYVGNVSPCKSAPAGFPLYAFPGGRCHSFDADERFVDVPGQEWVEEF
jgi:hypothetical protein